MISSEYGWTSEQTLDLTAKELSWRIGAIVNRQNRALSFDAKLHGMNLKVPEESIDIQLTEDQEAAIQKARLEAIQRKKNG